MKLSHLLTAVSDANFVSAQDGLDVEATKICFDSRRVEPGAVFVAVRGEKVDGHDYLQTALNSGAAALVVEQVDMLKLLVFAPKMREPVIVQVANSRRALNQLAAAFFRQPARSMISIGITGTNGKTTTSLMCEAILSKAKLLTGVIGTIDHHLGDRTWPTELTTPDPVEFQKRLREFVDLGANAFVMEVSSHALDQMRVDEVPFNIGVFTNLTRDHLDYHKTIERYFAAKARLFSELLGRRNTPSFAIVNADDAYAAQLPKAANVCFVRYGFSPEADLRATVLETGFDGTRFSVQIRGGLFANEIAPSTEIKIQMPGAHNVLNACAALGAGLAAGASLDQAVSALAAMRGTRGRLEPVHNSRKLHVFVDYAHTDDALRTVLFNLGEIRRSAGLQNRIITVFGCGGDRDRGKRPLMLRAALDGSDHVIVTSDNPRTEDPHAIINEIIGDEMRGARASDISSEVDRKRAIGQAIATARPGDVVLIAGKGHETTQTVGAEKRPFDDVQVAQEFLEVEP